MGLRLSEMMLSLSETLPWHPMMIDEREVSREEFTFKDLGLGISPEGRKNVDLERISSAEGYL